MTPASSRSARCAHIGTVAGVGLQNHLTTNRPDRPRCRSNGSYPSRFVTCSHRTSRTFFCAGWNRPGQGFWPAGRILPTTLGFSAMIWSATSRRCTSTSRGKSIASRTRSPLTEATRTTPIGLAGSPMTTSSPSLRVMTSMPRTSCRCGHAISFEVPATPNPPTSYLSGSAVIVPLSIWKQGPKKQGLVLRNPLFQSALGYSEIGFPSISTAMTAVNPAT